MSKDPKSNYYDAGGIETLDIIKAKLTPEQYQGYLLGNALKYQCRMMHKTPENPTRDAEKAANYSKWLVDFLNSLITAKAVNHSVLPMPDYNIDLTDELKNHIDHQHPTTEELKNKNNVHWPEHYNHDNLKQYHHVSCPICHMYYHGYASRLTCYACARAPDVIPTPPMPDYDNELN